jgi:hypothetical protein
VGGAFLFLTLALSDDRGSLLVIYFFYLAVPIAIAISALVVCLTVLPAIWLLDRWKSLNLGSVAGAGFIIGAALSVAIVYVFGSKTKALWEVLMALWPFPVWVSGMAFVFWVSAMPAASVSSTNESART